MSQAEIIGDFPELEPDDITACLMFEENENNPK
jgi:uncharacterized protein (DUF433 family)